MADLKAWCDAPAANVKQGCFKPSLPLILEQFHADLSDLHAVSLRQPGASEARMAVEKAYHAAPEADTSADTAPAAGITTFMLKNIPHRIDVKSMLTLLNNIGFGIDYYDFFYMPHDGRAKFTKGYAFINIIDRTVAEEFVRRVDGMVLHGKTHKRVQVVGAAEQGMIPNLLTIQHTNWAKKEQYPLVRINGSPKHLTPTAALIEISSHGISSSSSSA
jgi:hypothetical protein